MAQKFKAVDLGAWSLKVVTLNRTLVGTGLARVEEHPMASRADGKGRDRETWKLLREVFGEKKLAGDAVTVGYPGERVLNRRLEVPFTDRSKVDQILPFELEQHVPYPADEIIGDYTLRKASGKGGGADIFASVVPREDIEEMIRELDAAKLDPRVIGHPILAMSKIEGMIRSSGSLEPMLLVDMGHSKTLAVLVLGGAILGVRSILRGGMVLTRRIARGLSVDMEEAERIKHGAHLFPAGQGEEGEGRTHEVAAWLREELVPVVRDLKVLLKTVSADADIPVYLFGGGARLQGLPEFFSAELGLRAEILEASQFKVAIPADLDDPGMIPALVLALDSVKGGDGGRINFRRLAFPYAGDFRNLRGRLVYLGLMAFLMVLAFITPSFLKYQAMSDMNEILKEEILGLSDEILGESLDDYDEVMSAFEGMPGAESWTVYPDMTGLEAFYEVEAVIATIDGLTVEGGEEDLILPEVAASPPEMTPEEQALAELEGALPSPDEIPPVMPTEPLTHGLKMNRIVVDMTNEAKGVSGMVEITGDCSSVATLELFETAVEQHPCFHNVVRSDQQVVVSDAERKGWQRFSLNFNVACPKAKDRQSVKDVGPGADKGTESSTDPSGKALPQGESGLKALPQDPTDPSREPATVEPEPAPGAPSGEHLPQGESGLKPLPQAPSDPNREPATVAPPVGVPSGKPLPRLDGPPHLGGLRGTTRVEPAPITRSGIPSPRTVERPVGTDLKRRIPSIRPGR